MDARRRARRCTSCPCREAVEEKVCASSPPSAPVTGHHGRHGHPRRGPHQRELQGGLRRGPTLGERTTRNAAHARPKLVQHRRLTRHPLKDSRSGRARAVRHWWPCGRAAARPAAFVGGARPAGVLLTDEGGESVGAPPSTTAVALRSRCRAVSCITAFEPRRAASRVERSLARGRPRCSGCMTVRAPQPVLSTNSTRRQSASMRAEPVACVHSACWKKRVASAATCAGGARSALRSSTTLHRPRRWSRCEATPSSSVGQPSSHEISCHADASVEVRGWTPRQPRSGSARRGVRGRVAAAPRTARSERRLRADACCGHRSSGNVWPTPSNSQALITTGYNRPMHDAGTRHRHRHRHGTEERGVTGCFQAGCSMRGLPRIIVPPRP